MSAALSAPYPPSPRGASDPMSTRDLFPPIEPFATGRLAVDAAHTLFWEQAGNPRGRPILFLHGGPGAGVVAGHRRFFDPAFWRIVLFDQRGCGRSTPHGELEGNTTDHLVADIERLRRHLEIESWVVFGGSWGSTLALAYAEAHTERCRGLVLRGIFLCRPDEIEWWLIGMRRIFPEAWREFAAAIPAEEREDLLAAYYRRLVDPDPAVHLPAARAWHRYEASCVTLLPDANAGKSDDRLSLSLARLEAHYYKTEQRHGERDLLRGLGRIRSLPAIIVQGRYDIVTPIETADELARAWPAAEYVIVPDAGHSAFEPGIRAALVAATERMKRFA
jgi:proline iminopeptidase